VLALALDTSSVATSAALVRLDPLGSPGAGDEQTLAAALHLPPARAGELLPDLLGELCAQAGVLLSDVQAMAVGLGPGSFTGLRVGLAAAKGLCYARGWPLVGASSLHALALSAARPDAADGPIAAAQEARAGELFLAAFSADGRVRLSRDLVSSARDVPAWLAALPAGARLVGPGARRNREALLDAGVGEASLPEEPSPSWPLALSVARLAGPALRAARFDLGALCALAPDYVAQSEPEKALAEGRLGR
jgi:tRNA threonylcarbamoyladenosine biosynthesis protein TsaB